MTLITIDIKSCRYCPFFKEGDRESTDGFDSGNDWLCVHPKHKKPRVIEPFVEWHEVNKVPIPDWCPAKIQ